MTDESHVTANILKIIRIKELRAKGVSVSTVFAHVMLIFDSLEITSVNNDLFRSFFIP
jgi:hypothetical protein